MRFVTKFLKKGDKLREIAMRCSGNDAFSLAAWQTKIQSHPPLLVDLFNRPNEYQITTSYPKYRAHFH